MYNRVVFSVLFILCCQLLSAQRVITGRVTDVNDSLPLPQVTVLITGTETGVPTDMDGRFQLTVPNTSDSLTFRYLGYKTQQVFINQIHLNIMLEPEELDLGQVMWCCMCYSYATYLRAGLISGANYTHYGFTTKFQIASIKKPFDFGYTSHIGTRLKGEMSYQFTGENHSWLASIMRFDNVRLLGRYLDAELEFGGRKIRLGDNIQELKESGFIIARSIKNGELGLGTSIQTEVAENGEERHMAFVAEWKRKFFLRSYLQVQAKRWEESTQIRWQLSRYFSRYNMELVFHGVHLKDYNELSLGLAYDFNF